MLGVRAQGCPAQERLSARHWSIVTNRTLGTGAYRPSSESNMPPWRSYWVTWWPPGTTLSDGCTIT